MLIEFDKVTKRFPLTTANDSVSFNIALNSIHGVVGENGAGKSTIMKILYGMYSHDSGEIRFRGERVQFSSPLDAIRRGIGMVHQHFMLIPRLTVWENILLGQEGSFWISATERKTPQLKPIFESSGLGFRLTDTVESLSVGQRQQVEILKLLYRESQVLILDEPTAVLTPQETKDLFQRLRQLKAQGKTIVIITHKIAEVLELTDTVTVMRQGRVVAHAPTHTLDAEHLTELIIGQACPPPHPRAQEPPGQPILEVQGISTRSHRAPLNKLKLTV
ncbi:MAG: ATP-binding cassette domain-containing protein, partial [Deltaproteobacteria bacterium]|nr:ATP-binding cassette domain-containing protein [Deltaproteobacteria bacterium]